ncbi:MAG: isochorismatase family protein [Myxococcales bacterium]|nr:isochorismatase family protein [Myxococcales bacterium]
MTVETEGPRTALLVVDMQREFLTREGMLREPVDGELLVGPLGAVVETARARGCHVVWIRSEYPIREREPPPLRPPRPAGARYEGVPENSDHLASGHAGSPCCAPGTRGAELYPPVAAMIQDGDLRVTKDRYSAFSETGLHEQLRRREVTRVLVCGVVANVCVRATATDAFFLGYEVTAITDCIGASTRGRMREGLDGVARVAALRTSAQLLSEWAGARRGLGAGDSAIHYGVLPPELAARAFEALRAEIAWQEMRHRGGPVPRRISIQGTVGEDGVEPVYRHPADEQPQLVPWTPTADALRRAVEARVGQRFNHALIQRYEGGLSYISPHADKTLDVERGSAVINLSLGATRTMVLRAKLRVDMPDGTHHYPSQRVAMPHNSLFVLGWATNRAFMHGIRQDKRPDREKRGDETAEGGERISLTFRTIATFQRRDGRLFGQGARCKTRAALDDAPPRATPEREEALAMLEAFGRENRSPDFDWDAHYGRGFDVLNFRVLNHARAAATAGEEESP